MCNRVFVAYGRADDEEAGRFGSRATGLSPGEGRDEDAPFPPRIGYLECLRVQDATIVAMLCKSSAFCPP